MEPCTAFGFAGAVGEGPCPGQPSVELAVKLMETAIDDAQANASKQCPDGCICKGKGVPVGPPTCYPFQIKGKQYHRWVVTATFDGECECPQTPKKKGPFKFIQIAGQSEEEARNKLINSLEDLPSEPIGDKSCQLIKRRVTAHRYTARCAGSCKKGNCPQIPRMTWDEKNKTIRLECQC